MGSSEDLGAQLGRPDPRGLATLRKRTGVVATISPLTVYVAGSTTASPVTALDHYTPVVGDHVQLFEDGPDLFVNGGLTGVPYWVSWLPVIRSNASAITLGAGGGLFGAYKREGATVHFRARVLFGGAGLSFPAGNFAITLPWPVNAAHDNQFFPVGWAVIADASVPGLQRTWDLTRLDNAADCGVYEAHTGNTVTNLVPWTWALGDYININGSYEAVV